MRVIVNWDNRNTFVRVTFGAFALVLLAVETASAADEDGWVWAKAPGRADLVNAYPVDAAKAGLAGSVKLRCLAAPNGGLQNCAVVEQSPTGKGFGAAALSLTPAMRLGATAADGRPIGGHEVVVPVAFEPSVLRGGAVTTAPKWLRRPTLDEMQAYLPAAARGLQGHATIECVVTALGSVEQCAITEETPAGRGFGPAAVAMSSLFILRPETRDGAPVGGEKVIIPIGFDAYGTDTQQSGSIKVLHGALWSAVPTSSQMVAAYPRAAIGKVASARVVLRCDIERDGRLDDCDAVQETPTGLGFARAAQGLVRDFRAITTGVGDKWGMPKVDVPFDFRDPSAPAPIDNPQWRTGVPSAKP